MDYSSIHGPGISNFSSFSPHRMPTVSAAQALQDLKSSPTRCISTGLSLLDSLLQNREFVPSDVDSLYGGVSRGKVTEVYGPPGVGKTALGIQLVASALHAGEGVVWVDASHPVPGSRLSQVLTSFNSTTPHSSASEPQSLSDLLDSLTHFSTPTLAHLIALLCHPNPSHPPPNTSLIVIDSFSSLISSAFPRTADANATPRKPGAPNPSARKFPILQYLISTLQKLAATRNIAIVIFSQCVTKMRPGAGAVLVPAINTTAWEQGLGCRIALFRDWGWDDEDGKPFNDVRLAQVIKAEGIAVPEGRTRLVGFTITETGLSPLTLPIHATHESPHLPALPITNNPSNTATPKLPQKRKLSVTDLEIPDSDAEDDEDYGWAEEDEEDVPAPPPQWQGSEDILVAPVEGEVDAEDVDRELDFRDEVEVVPGVEGRKEQKLEIDDSEDELAL